VFIRISSRFIVLLRLHLSEQYLTSLQTFAHFLRQANGRLQTKHVFFGKLDLFKIYDLEPLIFSLVRYTRNK
jgi:hypothetical protein